MSISNLDAKQATATFDSEKNTVTLTYQDSRKDKGEPLVIPVGALRSVAWKNTPPEGREKLTALVFTFRHPPRELPQHMQVGRVEAVTTRTNREFVERVQDAIAHTEPDEKWRLDVDQAALAQAKQRAGRLHTIVLLLVIALVEAGIAVGVRVWQDRHGGASERAQNVVESLSDEEKAVLFHNYLVTVGIRGTQHDEVSAAKAVCQQFDKGYSFDDIAMALLLVDNGMTPQQKGEFVGVSVNWWCPHHKNDLNKPAEQP